MKFSDGQKRSCLHSFNSPFRPSMLTERYELLDADCLSLCDDVTVSFTSRAGLTFAA